MPKITKITKITKTHQITKLFAREVLDSRGNPTVEVEAHAGALHASAMVPSGASTGAHEAVELRDGATRFGGKGVLTAVSNVNNLIAPKLIGRALDFKQADSLMIALDGTPNKSKLGANAILGVSMVVCRLQALVQETPLHSFIAQTAGTIPCLPIPLFNVINGGAHAGNELDFQEYFLVPAHANSFPDALRESCEVYHALKALLKKKLGSASVNVGDEGGFAPPLREARAPLDLIWAAVENLGFEKHFKLSLDCAATAFYENGVYAVAGKKYSAGELLDFYASLARDYPLYSIEDGFSEDDYAGWAALNKKLGSRLKIIGDDLLCTNPILMRKALKEGACNALLLKLNQIGSVSESLQAFELAQKSGWSTCVSHRSGETEDSFIADFAVGLGASMCKFGAPARSERTAKYNQLLRINEYFGNTAKYAGSAGYVGGEARS